MKDLRFAWKFRYRHVTFKSSDVPDILSCLSSEYDSYDILMIKARFGKEEKTNKLDTYGRKV